MVCAVANWSTMSFQRCLGSTSQQRSITSYSSVLHLPRRQHHDISATPRTARVSGAGTR